MRGNVAHRRASGEVEQDPLTAVHELRDASSVIRGHEWKVSHDSGTPTLAMLMRFCSWRT
jgi:hypothetical protein